MTKNYRNAMEALEFAIEAEIEGRDFYRFAISQVREPKAKSMFASLANDEEIHLSRLLKRYEFVASPASRPWYDAVMNSANYANWDGEKVPWTRHRSREKISGPLTELRALEIGIRAEHIVYDLYVEAVQLATDPDTKAVFEEIAEQEEGHVWMLEAEQAYLKKTGFWFDVQEFSLEKEG